MPGRRVRGGIVEGARLLTRRTDSNLLQQLAIKVLRVPFLYSGLVDGHQSLSPARNRDIPAGIPRDPHQRALPEIRDQR
jgi:hypothetical protein